MEIAELDSSNNDTPWILVRPKLSGSDGLSFAKAVDSETPDVNENNANENNANDTKESASIQLKKSDGSKSAVWPPPMPPGYSQNNAAIIPTKPGQSVCPFWWLS